MTFLVLSLVSLKGVIAFGTLDEESKVPKVLFWHEWTSSDNTGLSSDIVKAWKTLQKQNNIQLEQIKEIYVVSGPGSFTGIRVGAAFAAGLGYGLEIPVFSLSTYDLFSFPAGIPVRTHLAMETLASDCASVGIEFLFPSSQGTLCRLPEAGDQLLGTLDAAEELKYWPNQEQIERGLKKATQAKEPLKPDYGINPKIFGKR